MCVCLCVRYILHLSGYRAETWHRIGVSLREGHSDNAGRPHPPRGGGAWGPKSGSQVPHSQNGAFLGKLYKTKVEECPRFSGGKSGQIRSRTSPWGQAADPSTRGGSAAVVQLDEVVDLT